jgi:hypothetical protein
VHWLRVWCALLVLFSVGELRRIGLRHAYGAVTTEASLWQPVTTWQLAVRHSSLALPALDQERVRVLHVSDVHVSDSMPASYVEKTGRMMKDLAPDLIVLTGDYVSRAERVPAFERWLGQLPKARLGAYAVLGNHEYWAGAADAVRGALARAGVEVVSGRCARVPNVALAVCGTDEPWGVGLGDSPRPERGVVLALSHTPDNVYSLAERGADLVFAGHTHGGQMRLPFLGAIIVPSRFGRRFDEGHFAVGHTQLFVSAGVGADSPALRLWCQPELVVVDLFGSPQSRAGAD